MFSNPASGVPKIQTGPDHLPARHRFKGARKYSDILYGTPQGVT
jgi:hypothetical protein